VSVFNLPVLSQSLPQADSIIQVVDVLGQLNVIAEQMFSKLRDKADTQKRIIESITARINAASAKTSQLKGKKQETVVTSPCSYPNQRLSHYQNVFTPLPSKPHLCPLVSPVKPTKVGPKQEGPSNLDVDLSFSILDTGPRKLSETKYVPAEIHSVDGLVPFGMGKPKPKKSTKPKRKDDIDPLIWDDLMFSVSRDSQYRYVPGFQNFPESKNIPEHLMPNSVATNVSFEHKVTDDPIAPTLLLSLPAVGISEISSEPALPTPIDKPPSPEKDITQLPSNPALPPQMKTEQQTSQQPPYATKEEFKKPSPIIISPPEPKLEIESPQQTGLKSIPPPPPPPPKPQPISRIQRPSHPTRPPPPKEEDLHSELIAKIASLRAAQEEEPQQQKKKEEEEWSQ